jgi:hypothetical protein
LIKKLKNKEQRTKRLKKRTRPRRSRDAWVWGLPTWLGRYFYVFTWSKRHVLFSHFFLGKTNGLEQWRRQGGWQRPRPLQGKFSPAPLLKFSASPLKQSLRKKILPVILFDLTLLDFFFLLRPWIRGCLSLKIKYCPPKLKPMTKYSLKSNIIN